jgi:hypothetical protein
MAKRYYPTLSDQVHAASVYMARYNSSILVALTLLDPELVPLYTALRDAVVAFDEVRNQLVPILPDDPGA